jgi:glycosyltransferase involved in cell wall biosynthesis
MGLKMEIITIIPAYNEEKSINKVVKDTLKYSKVIVVDDGSTDETFIRAKNAGALVIKHAENRGKGAAIKTGFKNALHDNYKFFLIMDGDGQHDPHFIPVLVSEMVNADIVIGSRFKEKIPEIMPLQRRFSNLLTTKIIEYITGYHITDSQSGFRSFSDSAVRLFIEIPYNDYVYESEILYQASKNRLKINEIQIPCKYENEKSHMKWINVLRYIVFVIKLLFRKFQTKIKIPKSIARRIKI